MAPVVFARQPMTRAQRRQLIVMAVIAVGLLVALMVLKLIKGKPLDADDWVLFTALPVVFGILPLSLQQESSARLTVTDVGCSYEAQIPAWLKWAAPMVNWSTRWQEIGQVHLFARASMVAFTIKGRATSVRLPLLGWVPAHLAGAGVPPAEAVVSAELDKSPVWRELLARGFPKPAEGATLVDFDLAKHPASRGALVGCATLAGAGLVAILAERETYIADGFGFLFPHVGAGLIGLAAFWLWLARARDPVKLPMGIAPGIAVVAGMATALFSYGGLVVINRVVAPAVPTAYTIGSPCTTLVPLEAGLPRIIWHAGLSDYWCRHKEGTQFMIPVRRGLFGTHQFDQQHYVDLAWEWRNAKNGK